MKEKVKVPELRFPGFTDDWEERKLIDLATTYIGLVTTMTENYTNKGTLLIRNSDIKEGRFDLSNPIYLEEQFAEENKTRRMRKGDVVTVHTGDIGTSAMINNELEGAIGFATITTRPTKELDSNFLAWYFNSNYHKKYAKRMSTGDGRSNYNMKDFNKNVIPTPQIDEQQKIGAFFKQLDDTIALHQHKLDLLKEQKKGFLQKMFPKNGAKVPELRFAGFADAWEQRKLSDLMTFSNGINAPKENYGTGTKMISVMDILNPLPMKYDNILNSVAVDKKIEDKNKVEKGDLIFVRSSEIVEEVGWAKAYKEDHYALYSGFAIRGKRISSYNAYFIELTLNYANRKEIKRRAGGSTRFNVSQEILNSLNVLTPSISEQNQIDLFFTKIDDTITLHQRKLDLLKEQKKGFLQKMFI
ncbi:restriction endonuclease subunit S [Lactococcus petauri]|uniref:restriction endonuclease subunit S n=1 Tax=Lactococcus petauri TaxID=1940789 RepID=UPI00254F3294|nr:restriction endonuclease subunit S [Lactococcus petauri]